MLFLERLGYLAVINAQKSLYLQTPGLQMQPLWGACPGITLWSLN